MTANKSCKVFGNNIAYLREGKGEPVILVHGITTYSFIWRKIIPLLSGNYDVIAIDLLGCGNSSKPLDVDYSIKAQADIIAGFIKEMKLSKVHLIAHDIGGGVAQILSVNYPQLIKETVLINSVAYDFWPVQPIVAMRTPIIRQLAMSAIDIGAFKLVIKRGLFNPDFLTEELMELFWKTMGSRVGRKAFLHLAECLDNEQLLEISERLHNTKIPFLIIRGEGDVYLSSQICEKLHSNIKGSKLVKIKDAGHFMMEEVPLEIADAIKSFLSQEN